MDVNDMEKYYEMATDLCLSGFSQPEEISLSPLLFRLLDMPGLPMHCPVHHYIVPAALLTVCRKKQGYGADILVRDLEEARERAEEVPGGFCGYCGACGGAVGVGIFFSVITDSSPLSEATWGHLQRATAGALLDLAEVGGPRCCKRSVFTAVRSALPAIDALLTLRVDLDEPILCGYRARNAECIGSRCPFYSEDGVLE